MNPESARTTHSGPERVRIFVDFWNLQITMNQRERAITGSPNFLFDWSKLPMWLVRKAAEKCGNLSLAYEGMHVYASYHPRANDERLKGWLLTWLNRQPGVQVVLKERRPKDAPQCPSCRAEVPSCPTCGGSLRGTQEKGVDTAIVTDMIRLAWESAYDVAVLVSSDSDLVPAVEFLDLRGRKVIQAGFPPVGSHLAAACWASFDMFAERDGFRR
ncbi:MAG: NYN domain-containing protein [Chloroflexi bacterium]|nr:NYN domain-containing protein [Chloroflexota bacterium]